MTAQNEDRAELDILAGEYVFGLLSGKDYQRARHLHETNATFRTLANDWRESVAPLNSVYSGDDHITAQRELAAALKTGPTQAGRVGQCGVAAVVALALAKAGCISFLITHFLYR